MCKNFLENSYLCALWFKYNLIPINLLPFTRFFRPAIHQLMKRTIVLLGTLFLLSGCPAKPKQAPPPPPPAPPAVDNLVIRSNPGGASVKLSTGETCTTPCELSRQVGQPFNITLSKGGYKSQTVNVKNNLIALIEFNRKKGVREAELQQLKVDRLRYTPNPVDVSLEPVWTKR